MEGRERILMELPREDQETLHREASRYWWVSTRLRRLGWSGLGGGTEHGGGWWWDPQGRGPITLEAARQVEAERLLRIAEREAWMRLKAGLNSLAGRWRRSGLRVVRAWERSAERAAGRQRRRGRETTEGEKA